MSSAPLPDDRPPDPPRRREEPRLPPPFVRPLRPRSGNGGRGEDVGGTSEQFAVDRSAVDRSGPDGEREGPLWLRVLVGPDLAGRPAVRSLTPGARLSLAWWRLGLTPTARKRRRRFREAVVDGRGGRFAVEYARRAL